MYCYKLTCDDAEETIISENKLKLSLVVANAIKCLPNEVFLHPTDDWFLAIVNKVCEITGAKVIEYDREEDVEDAYFEEAAFRGSQDESEEDSQDGENDSIMNSFYR